MKKKKWTAILLFFVLLTVLGAKSDRVYAQWDQEPVSAVDGLKVEILWNGNGLVRIGRETPVTVRLTSDDAALSGMVYVNVSVGDGTCYLLQEPLAAVPGEQTQAVICVPVDYYTDVVEVSFRGEDGRLYGQKTIHVRPDYNSQEIYMAVIGEDISAMSGFDRVILNETRGTATRLFDYKTDTVPADPDLLKAYDVFLISGVGKEDLSSDRQSALSSWVYDGGVLLIGSDSGWHEELTEGSIHRENWGSGQYVYCGFPLQEVSVWYPGEDGMREFLKEAIGSNRLTAIEESIDYNYSSYWGASRLTSNLDPDRVPAVWSYVLVLAIYLIVLGPVLYVVLKKRGKRHMLRSCMVVVSLLFTGLIYMMGGSTRFVGPFMNYVAIQEIRQGQMMESVYVSMSSPYNGTYELEVSQPYSVSPMAVYQYTSASAASREEHCYMQICYEEENTLIQIHEKSLFVSRMIRLSNNGDSPYGEGITGQAALFEEELSGVLTNQSGTDLECVVLIIGGRGVLIRDWKAGESVDLAKKELRRLQGGGQDALLQEVVGMKKEKQLKGDREALAAWRYQVLSVYLDNMLAAREENAILLGFPAREREDIFGNAKQDIRGLTLMAQWISVDHTRGDLSYMPLGINRTEALQGTYDPGNSSTYDTLCVLQYDLSELQTERLLVTWSEETLNDEYATVYSGDLEFYNWKTGVYESVGHKTVYSSRELLPYLNEDQCLTVRYEMPVSEQYYYEIFLPEFAQVGRRMP